MLIRFIKRMLYSFGIQESLSSRRLRFIDSLLTNSILDPSRGTKTILDVGCATGKDAVSFFKNRDDVDIIGLDLKDYGLRQDNFNMIIGDADCIPFPDSYFDLTVSIGVLEHITPIEKLSLVIREIDRVSKSYVIVVPSVGTLIEPHISRVFWHLQDGFKKVPYHGTLLYMSDEAWLSFSGFARAETRRHFHVYPLISNLFIYKLADSTNRKVLSADSNT